MDKHYDTAPPPPGRDTPRDTISDAEVAAALREAHEQGFVAPYALADVGLFLRSPSDPPPGPDRDRALAAMRAVDHDAERSNHEAMRRVLEAARR